MVDTAVSEAGAHSPERIELPVTDSSASGTPECPAAPGIDWGDTPARRGGDELWREVSGLTHELNEALCSVANYLRSAELLLATDAPDSREKLRKAFTEAVAQSKRAAQTARRQCALLR